MFVAGAGGFTLFGPHTLDAYIQETVRLAAAMAAGQATDPGPPPPDQLSRQWSLVPPVVADGVPSGKQFGDVAEDVPRSSYQPGETVQVVFHSACPRNNIRAEGTFLAVERRDAATPTTWATVATDNDWATRFAWGRHTTWSEYSYATISWEIPADALPGTYRISHFGDYKHFLGTVHPFSGSSSEFEVGPPPSLLQEVQEVLVALGRKASLGGAWLLLSLHEHLP